MRRSVKLISTAFILWTTSCVPGWALSLAQLRTQARLLLRDTSSDVTYQRFSDSTLNTFLNEAQRDLQNRAWLLTATTSYDLYAGTQEYPMPDDFVTTIRVTVGRRQITQTSYNALDQNQTDWTIATATPTAYYQTSFTNGTGSNLGFVPKPLVTVPGAAQIFYVQQVAALAADADVPFLGKTLFVPYHDCLADFAAARGWAILGRGDLAQFYLTVYASRAEQARVNVGKQPNYQPGTRADRGPPQ